MNMTARHKGFRSVGGIIKALFMAGIAGYLLAGEAWAITSSTSTVTTVTWNPYRLRLWRGSLRLNRDEWPLIVRDRYTFQCGGKSVEPLYGYWHAGITTRVGSNSFEIQTEDPAGALTRRVLFATNSVELIFHLQPKPDYRQRLNVRYQVQLNPDYFLRGCSFFKIWVRA